MISNHIRPPEPLCFIAFKIPARMKRQLRVLAGQQGSNLSELIRSQCIVLLRAQAAGNHTATSTRIHFPGEIGPNAAGRTPAKNWGEV